MTGEAHEKAIEAAASRIASKVHWIQDDSRASELAAGAIAAYLASLAEQGDPLVRVSEVAEWLRGDELPNGPMYATSLARFFLARFAPEASS